MPRITAGRNFEPSWVKTDDQRRRWRQHFTIGLLGYVGCSSRFIADAVSLSDTHVRDVLKSQTVQDIDYSKVLTA